MDLDYLSAVYKTQVNFCYKYCTSSLILIRINTTVKCRAHIAERANPELDQGFWGKPPTLKKKYFFGVFLFHIMYNIENMVWLYWTLSRLPRQELEQDLKCRNAAQGADDAQDLRTLAGLQRPKVRTQIHCRSRS
jgi:hypothetical protein